MTRKAVNSGASRQIASSMEALDKVQGKRRKAKVVSEAEAQSYRVYLRIEKKNLERIEERAANLRELTGLDIQALTLWRQAIEKNEDYLVDQIIGASQATDAKTVSDEAQQDDAKADPSEKPDETS